MLQQLLAFAIVGVCLVYVLRTLLPPRWRRQPPGRACGCAGCDAAAPASGQKPPGQVVIQWVRRPHGMRRPPMRH